MAENVSIYRINEQANHKLPLKILVCCNKPESLPSLNDGILFTIQSGKALTDTDLHMQADDELNGQPCDNISTKNESYGEFTAMYWAWKHLRTIYPDVKYVGWSHYRRLFAFDDTGSVQAKILKPESEIANYKADWQSVIKILDAGKIILVKPEKLSPTVQKHFQGIHYLADYEVLKGVIREYFPDYYDDFINVMERNSEISLYCMFVMKYDDFVKYCEWLFAVLEKVEPQIPYQYYDAYQKRVLAFMAERLINVYVRKNKMNVEYRSIYFYSGSTGSAVHYSKFVVSVHNVLHMFRSFCRKHNIFWPLKMNKNTILRALKKFPLKH